MIRRWNDHRGGDGSSCWSTVEYGRRSSSKALNIATTQNKLFTNPATTKPLQLAPRTAMLSHITLIVAVVVLTLVVQGLASTALVIPCSAWVSTTTTTTTMTAIPATSSTPRSGLKTPSFSFLLSSLSSSPPSRSSIDGRLSSTITSHVTAKQQQQSHQSHLFSSLNCYEELPINRSSKGRRRRTTLFSSRNDDFGCKTNTNNNNNNSNQNGTNNGANNTSSSTSIYSSATEEDVVISRAVDDGDGSEGGDNYPMKVMDIIYEGNDRAKMMTGNSRTRNPRRRPRQQQPKKRYMFSDVALILNTNAKAVTDGIIETAKQTVLAAKKNQQLDYGTDRNADRGLSFTVYVTSTEDDAKEAAKTLVNQQRNKRRHHDEHQPTLSPGDRTLVVPVGGDGTVTSLLQLMWDETTTKSRSSRRDAQNYASNTADDHVEQFPFIFAYVAMGTGNALGSVVGCRANRHQLRKNHGQLKTTRSNLLQATKNRLKRFFRTPRRRKLDSFQETLEQIICVVEEWNSNMNNGKSGSVTPYDIVEAPLLRVQTTPINPGGSTEEEQGDQTPLATRSYYSFFAGVGFDSLMLQDYQDQQAWRKTRMPDNAIADSILSGVTGYTTALFTRTLPKCLPPPLGRRAHLMRVQISTDQASRTSWIDHRRGDFLRPITSDDEDIEAGIVHGGEVVLYEGKAGIVASSTVPFYGGGLRLFPFARMGGTTDMHLRVGRIHPFRGVINIPKIFEGSYRDKRDGAFGCLDFIGPSFSVRILDYDDDGDDDDVPNSNQPSGYPVQHSGESVGRSTKVEMEIASGDNTSTLPPIQFLTLLHPRPVSELDTWI